MNNNYPIVGKFYKVVIGPHKEFIGECISFDINHDLSVILQDLRFNGAAVRLSEIEETLRQPGGKDISNEQKNLPHPQKDKTHQGEQTDLNNISQQGEQC